jgi:hypothetical protein
LTALPTWKDDDRKALAQAIRQDSANAVLSGAGTVSREDFEATVLQQVVDSLGVPPPAPEPTKVDLPTAIAQALPFLSREVRHGIERELFTALEVVVGERLTRGMPDYMLDEFGCFVDRDGERIARWLAEHRPGYPEDPAFLGLLGAGCEGGDDRRLAAMSEYGATLWLRLNRPEYPQVVAKSTADLMDALREVAAELGEEAFHTWARVERRWEGVIGRAEDAKDAVRSVMRIAVREGGAAVEAWAAVTRALYSISERVTDRDGEWSL